MNAARVTPELRRAVQERAGDRCEHCLTPGLLTFLPLQVDHIVAQKHAGETVAENLALCCAVCNQHKGSDLTSIDPDSGELTRLYHPRRDKWEEHFEFRGLFIAPKSATGRVTVRLLQFNAPERITEREWFIEAGVFHRKS